MSEESSGFLGEIPVEDHDRPILKSEEEATRQSSAAAKPTSTTMV